jgi:hypothetical protein
MHGRGLRFFVKDVEEYYAEDSRFLNLKINGNDMSIETSDTINKR